MKKITESQFQTNGQFKFNPNYQNGNGLTDPSSCYHAFVKVKGVCFDAESTKTFYQDECLIIPEEVVIKSINNAEWNNFFNRKHVYDIEQNLQIDLSDIER